MSNFLSSGSSQSTLNIRLQVGLETDIGGGKENQDDSFVWYNKYIPFKILSFMYDSACFDLKDAKK